MELNPLPSGTLATFFLMAVGPIQHIKEGYISREKTVLMTSLRLERSAAVRWRHLLITFPQNVKVSVYSLMWWRKCGPIGPPPWENGGSSGRRCRTMVSLEPPWKDASIDTPNTLIRGSWGRQNYFLLNQRYFRPPMSDTAADGLIKPPWKYASIETPHILIRGPWGCRHHFDTHTIFPTKSIGLIEPLPLGIVVIHNTVILSRGRLHMTYTLSMVQKKIIFRQLGPNKVMLRFQNKPKIQPEEYLTFDGTLP